MPSQTSQNVDFALRRLSPSGWWLVLVVILVMTSTGCVRRRLTFRSNPPGAIVHVDNQRIGTTPCSVDYIYYGTREIRLSAPGYETLTVNQPLPAPWYETPGIDFISEVLVLARIEDKRTLSFDLERRKLEAPEVVIARGEQLRQQMTPLGAAPINQTGGNALLDPPPLVSGNRFEAAGSAPPAAPQFPPPTQPAVPAYTPQPAPGLPDTFRY